MNIDDLDGILPKCFCIDNDSKGCWIWGNATEGKSISLFLFFVLCRMQIPNIWNIFARKALEVDNWCSRMMPCGVTFSVCVSSVYSVSCEFIMMPLLQWSNDSESSYFFTGKCWSFKRLFGAFEIFRPLFQLWTEKKGMTIESLYHAYGFEFYKLSILEINCHFNIELIRRFVWKRKFFFMKIGWVWDGSKLNHLTHLFVCELTEWIGEQDPTSIFGRLHGSS